MRNKKYFSYACIILFLLIVVLVSVIVDKATISRKEMTEVTIINAEADSQHITRPVSNLWDEDKENTFWSSDENSESTTEETVVLYLKDSYPVCGIELYPCTIEDEISYFPQNFTISVSADGEDWEDVYTKKDYKVKNAEGQMFSFKPQENAKYVKIQMKSDSSYIRLSEVVVYQKK